MNVYEQVKNMSMEEFRGFCYWLYNEGYSDRGNAVKGNDGMYHVVPVDNEDYFYYVYPEQKDVYPEIEHDYVPEINDNEPRPSWWPTEK